MLEVKDAIESFLPTEGLFTLYKEYTQSTQMCPRFNFFSLAALIGAIIKRKVSFQRSSYALFPPLFPNIWVILLAPQGKGNKSSALRVAKNLSLKLSSKDAPKFLAAKLTPEALVKAMAGRILTEEVIDKVDKNLLHILKKSAQGVLYGSELGVLLGKEKYNTGMIALLTDLYDCPTEWSSDTVTRGDQKLYNVCISIMGASTPDWMQSMLPTDAFKGGFMSRLLFVAFPEGWNRRIADPLPPPEGLEEKLLQGLVKIAQLKGDMSWTKDAKQFFSDWYMNLPNSDLGVKASYLERKQDHLLKLAMILQIAQDCSLTMTKETLTQSLHILGAIEPETLRMIEYISIDPRMRICQRIMESMESSSKGVSEAEILDYSWRWLARAGEFDEAIRLLLRTKKIEMITDGSREVKYQLVKEKVNNEL